MMGEATTPLKVKEREEDEKRSESFGQVGRPGVDGDEVEELEKKFKVFSMQDKLLVFGGWKPYENLTDIEVFD